MPSVSLIFKCKHYINPIPLYDKVMGSCLCKEKKTKSSRSAGGGEESYARSTRGGGCRGNQTGPHDKRTRAGGRSTDIVNEENDVTLGGAVEDRSIEIFPNDQSGNRLSSQSM